tara:strand:+ start:265 stop:990 length:726 start_codon:yes stop_codon:yes gene_type:complete
MIKLRELIRETIKEIDFKDQQSFRAYQSKHKMRPTTKVNIAGKDTTVGQATGKSDKPSKQNNKKIDKLIQGLADYDVEWDDLPSKTRKAVTSRISDAHNTMKKIDNDFENSIGDVDELGFSGIINNGENHQIWSDYWSLLRGKRPGGAPESEFEGKPIEFDVDRGEYETAHSFEEGGKELKAISILSKKYPKEFKKLKGRAEKLQQAVHSVQSNYEKLQKSEKEFGMSAIEAEDLYKDLVG